MLSKIRDKLSHYTWEIAYGEYREEFLYTGIDWKKLYFIKNPYKTKWFADPFVFEITNEKIVFFVEEFDSKINRGRIAKISVNRNNQIIEDCKILLDLPSHLSFPVIYKEDSDIYVHPENSASGKSTMYRYDTEKDMLVDPIVVSNLPLVDPIIKKEDKKYKMYATKLPDAGDKELIVLESNHFTGPYEIVDTILFDRREARMAGAFIETTKGYIRPAQDCNRDYGEAVLFYVGKDVIYRQCSNKLKYEGLHTFNVMGDFFVIDVKKYDYPLIHRILKRIRHLF